MKLKIRLIFLNLGIVMLVIGVVMSSFFITSYSKIKKVSLENIGLKTETIAGEMQAVLEDAENDVKDIKDILVNMKKSRGTDRAVVIEMLREVLENNPNYVYLDSI
ncbi:hypothetical protein SAMN02745945_00275 [Peptoclostridium litorale DSM 5388]|uniref:Uncharacterized protein n=1 Tax=Peptoclostridium litorale DSM 5388 TaxID=1121324 RepID=A0A069RQN1_PEPLI|nr:hypothetical protein [Peptoclostridium litorale]KDR96482.1 hypothetical protein CLIT_2c00880 [Peptoclostridium litorale DSM 5388]SIN70079.1 hypothetical protein SAMN02745945_00275 [Peptoclostridium litorale DSM 5388]